jgi:glycosyltransferase involved in cell wall biosynthesis
MHSDHSPRLAMFLPSLRGGGAERMMVNLLRGMTDAGIPVDLVLAQAEGTFLSDVPPSVRVIDCRASHVRHAIWPLARYLRRERPYGLLSRLCHANVAAAIARMLARVDTRLMMIEDSTLSANIAVGGLPRTMVELMRRLYPRADAIAAVSEGVARDLEIQLGLSLGRVRVIYNPVVDASLLSRAQLPPTHDWLDRPEVPVFLAVGRLNVAKDYETLLRAFAILRAQRPARLLILGEGEERRRLEMLVAQLGLQSDVQLPGFSDNAYAAMRCASAFVLSSRFEGLPGVLIEALACGCPVVSTDCPSGPAEILAGGKYGLLAPTGNPTALSCAMLEVLSRNWDRNALRTRGQSFSLSAALPQYLEALQYPLPASAISVAA